MKLTEFEQCARRLKALADPARLRIVETLLAGPQNVGDLAAALKEEVVNVSHHLGVLRNAGLVETEKHGRFVVYSLHPDVGPQLKANKSCKQLDLGCCKLDLQ